MGNPEKDVTDGFSVSMTNCACLLTGGAKAPSGSLILTLGPPEIWMTPSVMLSIYPWLPSRPKRAATEIWPAMGLPSMMLPVTEVSKPPAPAEHSCGNGLYVVGYETMRFFGTVIKKELTLMVPPALYSVPAVQLLGSVYLVRGRRHVRTYESRDPVT